MAVPCKTAPHRLAASRAYYWRNRDTVLARQKAAALLGRKPRKTKQDMHKYNLQAKYGITPEQYATMLQEQNGVCASCGRPETRVIRGKVTQLCVDHDHATGRVRHLLCHRCNAALGHFEDDENRILQLAAYAKRIKDEAHK